MSDAFREEVAMKCSSFINRVFILSLPLPNVNRNVCGKECLIGWYNSSVSQT